MFDWIPRSASAPGPLRVQGDRSRQPWRASAICAAALVASPALAQDGGAATTSGSSALSADPEMVFMRYGDEAIPGVHVPSTDVRNTVRVGLAFQYQRNPVVAYRLDEEIGPIVENRLNAQVGISWDFTKWGTARFMLPVNANWGSSISGFQAPGAGVGDIMAGVSFLPYQSKWFNFGVRGDIWFPSGRAQAYMGEKSVRGNVGITAMGKFAEIVDLVGDAAVLARTTVDTQADYNHGPELVLSEALRIKLPWVPVRLVQTLIARGGFTNFFKGGAENALEILGGVQVPLANVGYNTDITIDAMAGRGTNQGFGATDLRVLAALTVTRNPGRKPKPIVKEVVRPPVVTPPPVYEPEEPPPDAKAVEKEDMIEIREPIEFFVDTANIKPESLDVLREVAAIMNGNATIMHLVVEGHASAEGDFEYNYDLSKSRAESVWKQLILDGVAPERVSFRGMGEVRPKNAGDDETALQENRRVEFRIVGRYGEFDEFPDYGTSTAAPWNGGSVKLERPLTPAEKAERKMREAQQREADKASQSFEDEPDDGFRFEEPGATTPQVIEREEIEEVDMMEGASFDDGADDFQMEGAEPEPEPVEAPAPEPEPTAPEPSDAEAPADEEDAG